MKRLIYLALVPLALLLAVSCQQKPKSADEEARDFRASLTETDTASMLKLCDDCMELLKQKDVEGALAMLCEYDDSTHSVAPLSEEVQARYRRRFSLFPVVRYQRTEYKFQTEGLNDVKYEVYFGDNAKTSYMFNPVKIDGEWHLSVKRADQQVIR